MVLKKANTHPLLVWPRTLNHFFLCTQLLTCVYLLDLQQSRIEEVVCKSFDLVTYLRNSGSNI
jgi:hypothetical protein